MSPVWLIRHGESQSNAGEVTRAAEASALTIRGRQEAMAVAEAVPRAPDLVIHTPYRRTGQTALALLERFPDVEIEEWPLHEFTYLDPARYRNTTLQDREPEKSLYWARCDPQEREGGKAESWCDFVARVDRGLARLIAERRFLVVFTHGHVMRAMLLHLLEGGLGTSRGDMRRYDHLRQALEIPNGAILKLDRIEGETRISGLLTTHLAAIPTPPRA